VTPVPAAANFVCELFPAIATRVGQPVSLPWVQPKFKLMYAKWEQLGNLDFRGSLISQLTQG